MPRQPREPLNFFYEEEQRALGYAHVCGVDEAGRGPLAGPVFAAAVLLPAGLVLPGLNDSKKLTPQKREELYDQIVEQAVSYGIAQAGVEEIETLNILGASLLAMRRAVEKLSPPAQAALVDGNRDPGLSVPTRCIVQGDGISPSIAAASILAKVSRDRLMQELDGAYPQYGFAQHKGYPTKLHYQKLLQYGPSPVHRPSFLRNLSEKAKLYDKE